MMKLSVFTILMGSLILTTSGASAAPPIPDTVVWTEGVEYTNPDDQHLQLNLARPKTGEGPFPAVICCGNDLVPVGAEISISCCCS